MLRADNDLLFQKYGNHCFGVLEKVESTPHSLSFRQVACLSTRSKRERFPERSQAEQPGSVNSSVPTALSPVTESWGS